MRNALLAAGLLAGIGSWSPVTMSMGIVDLFVDSQNNDPIVLAARKEYEAIQQVVPEARGLYLPNVAVTADFQDTDQTINSSDNEVFGIGTANFPTDVLTVSLSQPIFRYDFIMQFKQAKEQVMEAGIRAIAAEQDLILRVATTYLEVLAAKDSLDFALAEQEAYQQQLNQIEKRKDVGFANATEVYESKARFEFTRSTVAEAQSNLQDAMEGILELTGQDPESEIRGLSSKLFLTEPDPVDSEQWVARAMEGNLQLQARVHAVQASNYEIRRQRAAALPTVDLLFNNENRVTEGSLFGGGSDVDTTDVLVRVRVPLFQGGQVRARTRSAKHRYAQAMDIAQQERRAVRRGTQAAYFGVVNGITKVNALEQSVESQELTLESKLKGYKAGTSTNLEVLDAQRDLFLVRRDFARARYDYLLSMLNLKSQVGSLSVEDLEVIDRQLDN